MASCVKAKEMRVIADGIRAENSITTDLAYQILEDIDVQVKFRAERVDYNLFIDVSYLSRGAQERFVGILRGELAEFGFKVSTITDFDEKHIATVIISW